MPEYHWAEVLGFAAFSLAFTCSISGRPSESHLHRSSVLTISCRTPRCPALISSTKLSSSTSRPEARGSHTAASIPISDARKGAEMPPTFPRRAESVGSGRVVGIGGSNPFWWPWNQFLRKIAIGQRFILNGIVWFKKNDDSSKSLRHSKCV